MKWGATTLLGAGLVVVLAASGNPQSFGKNKVKYDRFDWSYISTEHFDVYFYQPGDRLARRAAYVAELAYSQISRDLDYELKERVPIIVYISHNDFEQTNVITEIIQEEVGGFTELFKNRVVVPFDGSWGKFRHVVHHELTHAVTFDMLYGDLLESLMSRQYLFQMPLWFAEGLAEYESLPWDAECDMFIRDAVISDYLPPIEHLDEGYLVYKAGQSAVKFLADTYGRDKIGEVLKRTAASKSVRQSIRLVTGLELKDFSKKWQKAMRRTHWPEVGQREEPEDVAKRLTEHKAQHSYLNYAPAFSPQGDKIAFVSDRDDYKSVFLMSAIDGRILTKLRQGETESGFEEMHWQRGAITWSPDGRSIAFSAKGGARDALYVLRAKDGAIQKRWRPDLDAVFSPDWSPDGRYIVFVGLEDGASNLYVLDTTTGQTRRITDDPFDEASPCWSPDGTRIAFASDRARAEEVLDLEGLTNAYNIWTIRPDGTQLTPIVTGPADERAPTWSPDGQHMAFASDENGVYNLYVVGLDSLDACPVTNTLTGCFDPDWSPDGRKIAFVSFQDEGWDIFLLKDPLAHCKDGPLKHVAFRATQSPEGAQTPALAADSPDSVSAAVLASSVAGVEPVEDAAAPQPGEPPLQASSVGDTTTPSRGLVQAASAARMDSLPVRQYRLKFSPDIIYAVAGYSSYSGLGGEVLVSFSDIMGNHRCMIYTNLFYSLQDSDFQLVYYYLRRRVNYGLALFQAKDYYVARDDVTGGYQWFSDRIYGGALLLSRPFTKFTRVDFDLLGLAIDRQYYYADVPDQRHQVIFPSLSLINDTVLWGSTGPVNGGRSMASLEYCPGLGANSFSFGTVTFDARRYVRFEKKYTLALRTSGGISFGEDPPRFFLGGTRNWLSPKYARTGEWEDQDIFFARFPAPLRGTRYYEVSGTRYALVNVEFRYPFIHRFVTGWPVSIFLSDITGALFVDIGSAWTHDRSFQGIRVGEDGIPRLHSLKAGYGCGARINLGIAVLRFDAAWRTDLASTSAKPRYYLSLGSEF